MTEKELFERWVALKTDYDKSVFNECGYLCNFMNDGDYYFYPGLKRKRKHTQGKMWTKSAMSSAWGF